MDYWNMDKASVAEALGSDPAKGLTAAEAQKRLQEFGANRLIQEINLTFIATFWIEAKKLAVDVFLRGEREMQAVRVKR